jgi:hypothetical protein
MNKLLYFYFMLYLLVDKAQELLTLFANRLQCKDEK